MAHGMLKSQPVFSARRSAAPVNTPTIVRRRNDETGDHGFGSYRTFGDLYLEFASPDQSRITSPSGHERGDGMGRLHMGDDDPEAALRR